MPRRFALGVALFDFYSPAMPRQKNPSPSTSLRSAKATADTAAGRRRNPEAVQEPADAPSRLQRDLLPRILDLVRQDGLEPGHRLMEAALARRLQVSRTPVRAALRHLADRGVLGALPTGGYALARPVDGLADKEFAAAGSEVDIWCARMARDRLSGALPPQISEADLMRRYGLGRPLLLRILNKLAEVGMVERLPGHGWLFSPVNDPAAISESYAFRRIIEPASLLECGARVDRAWLAEMRRRHEDMLARTWSEGLSVSLFEMNADFHEGLIAASGNRYLLLALQQQTRLRRYTNYEWRYGPERVKVSCQQHLEIIGRLEAGEVEVAAALLRQHLDLARTVSLGPR
ncbi:GntR family transcriptional regulator [Phreatobacter sp. AB_2022a]|uniref:GntR family transcriptional regulator n=1 Tax=Phreatobacter sp. AB_2022a TaxID=3003134 RepID=UPI002286D2D4|nr:GntR family transcriptional regulator [Phreatobacter sp. AB_2022a]MCZ0734340.1 GntR family transcriptional regulator [Phreatobacter sp. AB_2022a]